MTDTQVIAAIRKTHLRANIRWHKPKDLAWGKAWIDSGGTIFGPGPYAKVPIVRGDWKGTVIRVYPPERLRKRLARDWRPSATGRAK